MNSSAKNGVAKRKQHSFGLLVLYFSDSVPKEFWTGGILTAVFLTYRIPLLFQVEFSPFELLFSSLPSSFIS